MVEAIVIRPASDVSSTVSDINEDFIRRMLELMDLPPCQTIKEGIKTVRRTMQAGIFTEEQLDGFVEQAFDQVHGPNLDYSVDDELQNKAINMRIKSLQRELAALNHERFNSEVVEGGKKLEKSSNAQLAQFVFKSEARKFQSFEQAAVNVLQAANVCHRGHRVTQEESKVVHRVEAVAVASVGDLESESVEDDIIIDAPDVDQPDIYEASEERKVEEQPDPEPPQLQIAVPEPEVIYVDAACSPINFEQVELQNAAVQVNGPISDIYSENSYNETDLEESKASDVNWSTLEEINRNGVTKRKESFSRFKRQQKA